MDVGTLHVDNKGCTATFGTARFPHLPLRIRRVCRTRGSAGQPGRSQRSYQSQSLGGWLGRLTWSALPARESSVGPEGRQSERNGKNHSRHRWLGCGGSQRPNRLALRQGPGFRSLAQAPSRAKHVETKTLLSRIAGRCAALADRRPACWHSRRRCTVGRR